VQNLSSGTDHKCYIITKLDNDTSLISTSDSKTITTSYTGSTYYYYSISSITGGTWGTSDEAFASSYSGQYMYGVASSSNYFNYSSDYGANWTAYQINTSFYTKGICCSWDGSIVFVVGTQGSSYGTLYKSTDYGVSFTQITSANFSSTTDYFWDVACSSDGKYVYICSKTTTGYYYSSDYGVSWTKLTNIASNNIKCSPDGKYVVCSSSSSTVYAKLSSDYGLTWSNLSIYTGYSNCAISQNGTYILLYNTTAGYWTLSTNGGTSFTSITTLYYAGASNPRDGCSMSYTGQYMFITYSNGTYLSGLAYSMDYGSTWQFVMYSKPYCSNSLALGNHTKPICVAPSGNYAVGRYNGNNTTFVLNLTSTTVMKSTSFYDIIPTTNLLFLYKFATTDVSGTTSLANYATGTAVYDATLSNSLAVGSTSSYIKYGTGYLAPNYYVTLKSFTTAYANGWCLSEWVLYTATPYGSLFHYYTAAGSGGNPDLTMYYSTTKTLQVYSLPASDWLGNGAYMKTVDDGTYHHIVINSIYVSSSLNIIQHFYDGTLIMEYYDTNTTNTSNVTPVYNYINTRGGSQVHNGYTSCFRFYQRNLSLSEILKLYCSGM
jgi:photosystem II stability/assembly factor-like uncharacterized protein